MSRYYQLMHRDLPLITFEVQPAAPASGKLESHYQVLACAEDRLTRLNEAFRSNEALLLSLLIKNFTCKPLVVADDLTH